MLLGCGKGTLASGPSDSIFWPTACTEAYVKAAEQRACSEGCWGQTPEPETQLEQVNPLPSQKQTRLCSFFPLRASELPANPLEGRGLCWTLTLYIPSY